MKEKTTDNQYLVNTLPRFDEMKPKTLERDFNDLLKESRWFVEGILLQNGGYTWENFVEPMNTQGEKLDKLVTIIAHLNGVVSSKELGKVYETSMKNYTAYVTKLGQRKDLFDAYQSIVDGIQYDTFTSARKKVLSNILRDFRLSGVDLPSEKKKRFGEIQEELSVLSSQFGNNVLAVTQEWSKHTVEARVVSGIPQATLDGARKKAEDAGQLGWLLGLDIATYIDVMTYGNNRELRKEMYTAYGTRASNNGPHDKKYDNTDIVDKKLSLRHEMANILGFKNYAELSLATKMVDTTDEVTDFVDNLTLHARTAAQVELKELSDFAKKEHKITKLAPWDIAFCAEQLKEQKHNVSSEEVREYFPIESVIAGAYEVAKRLYGVSIIEVKEEIHAWHSNVRLFEVFSGHGALLGRFYTDLHIRSTKRGGAWANGFVHRQKTEKGIEIPLGILACNFPPLVEGTTNLTHYEVETFFHEFGHTLHNMLTLVDEPSIAGFGGVEWDAVELPSQLMENWCWEKEALAFVSKHYKTGESIPDELFANMLSAKNFQSAMGMIRQLTLTSFDFRLHLEYDPKAGSKVQETYESVMKDIGVAPTADFVRLANAFTHIFDGGYSAGYYSYKWAEVLSADVFAKFKEEGIFDRKTGKEFLGSILSQGGQRSAMDNFIEFRGRKPKVEALLEQYDLLKK